MKTIRTIKTISCAAALLLSANAVALPITLEVVSANWSNVVGGGYVEFADNDGQTGNEEIYWGGSSQSISEKSGYVFDSAAPPSTVVQTGDQFTLGSITHINQPIPGGTGIESAQLNITADLSINGSSLSEGPFTFSFLHDETTNSCNTGPNCADDLVNFSPLDFSSSFNVDGIDYTLSLLGFLQNGSLTDTFRSPEGQSNTADLIAKFDVRPTEVPEPGTFALLSLGLLALRFSRRPLAR